jgi:chromosome segregation ATPase
MLIVSYRLEVKLVTLNECKAELEAQLQQERRTLGRLRRALANSERKQEESKRHVSYLEVMLNKYEQRNYDLEESEVDLRHRLEMLEICLPALIIWSVWRIVQDTRILRIDANLEAMSGCLVKVITADHHGVGRATADSARQSSVTLCTSCSSEVDSSRFTEVEQERPIKKADPIGSGEVCPPTEEQLQDLEAQVVLLNEKVQSYEESEDKYKKRITELEDDLEGIKSGLQVGGIKASDDAAETELSQNHMADVESKRCANLECMIKVQELEESEANMKKRIVELERKEGAYLETLQKADELWSDMETSYKRRISTAEDNEAVMKETIRKLQESETKLRQMFRQENDMLLEKIQNVEENVKMFKERSRALETEKVQLTDEINHLRDTLHSEQKELEKTKETVTRPLKEELLKERRLSKALRDEISTVERDSQNRSRDQKAQVSANKSFNSKHT